MSEIKTKIDLIQNIENKNIQGLKKIFEERLIADEEIITYLRYHKMDLFLYEIIKDDEYYKDNHKELVDNLKAESDLMKYRKGKHLSEYQRIFDGFKKKSVRYLVLKGFGLDYSVFNKRIVRKYSDIDFLVCPDDLDAATEVCESLGYIQGDYNYEEKKIIPYSRKDILNKRLYSHELAQFVKVLEDGFVSNIDINFKFSWTGYKGIYESLISFDDAYSHSYLIDTTDAIIRVLDKYYNCIHLCCHFFNSCVNFLIDYEYKMDCDPREFDFSSINDIYEIIHDKEFDYKYFRTLVDKYEVWEQVNYAFHLITVFFDIRIPFFDYDSDLNSLEKINYYVTRTGKKKYWNISFLTRIFDIDEKNKFIQKQGFDE